MKAGYDFSSAGENLAVNFSDSKDVIDAWMNSPEHRANILSNKFTEIGVATAMGTYEGSQVVFVVQEFGTPAVVPAVTLALVKPTTSTKHPKTIASKPAIKPVIVAANLSSTETFAEVKGASMNTLSSTAPSVIAIASGTQESAVTSILPKQIAPEVNIIQTIAATPHTFFDYILMILCAILLFALALNIFIKIRIQHPILIANGLSLVVIIGVFITANQNLFSVIGKIL